MSIVKVSGNASGTGTLTIAAPNTNSDFTLTLPAATGTVALTSNIPTAPTFGRVVRTAGSVSTTSTSLVDLTGASITLTTGAFPAHISFAGTWYNDTSSQALYINADIDGALELGTSGITENNTNNQEANASFSIDSAALTAASHTFKIKWRVSAGTGVMLATTAFAYNFSVHEIR
jgi:hypothetical protein